MSWSASASQRCPLGAPANDEQRVYCIMQKESPDLGSQCCFHPTSTRQMIPCFLSDVPSLQNTPKRASAWTRNASMNVVRHCVCNSLCPESHSQLYQTQAVDDGGTMYTTMCSSAGSDQRGGHENLLLSRQATSAELIASIRFSTRPEDVLYLHLKDGKAPHTIMIITQPPTSATTHNAHSTHNSLPTRCSASTQSSLRARHLDGNHRGTAAPPVLRLSPTSIHATTSTSLS